MNTTSTSHHNLRLRESDLVMCDFDGTISQEDVGLAFIEALDLQEAWEIELRWRRGEMSSRECLSRQWGMVRLSPPDFMAMVDRIPVDPDFPAFVDLCRRRGAGIVVVSDGLDIYVDRMIERMGLRPYPGDMVAQSDGSCLPRLANHAEFTPGGLKISFPHQSEQCSLCGNCKTAHLFRLRRDFQRVIYIGDGYSDRCPARYEDVVFAKSHLAEICQEECLPCICFNDFADILQTVS